ncbi:Adenylate kinase, partial [Geodia barretti]
ASLRLVLFGPPGAGKGTQAQLLTDCYHLAHVSSGDIFRHNLRQGTPLGLRAKEYMDRGELVPDEVVIDIMLDKILSIPSEDGFILDGFPRNTWQAEQLESALTAGSRAVDRVLHIDVAEEELARRLGGRFVCRECQAPYTHLGGAPAPNCERCNGELYQRDDDRPEAVQKRINVYREETTPVLAFYRDRGLLVDIPGQEAVDGVFKHIVEAL